MAYTYAVYEVCAIIKGQWVQKGENVPIEHLVYDSRSVSYPATSLFFALTTARQDGHRFIKDAYEKGVRCFVVQDAVDLTLSGTTIIRVPQVLAALQAVAIHHRQRFTLPVIGITGSNGKTIVKEWLYQLLRSDYNIVRSPKSFNSQIGVPLSVWQLNTQHTLGIFEAGISLPGEMEKLAAVIQPTIGIFTNLGEAHSEGFSSAAQKKAEKLLLFKKAELVIGPYALLQDLADTIPTITWGNEGGADLHLVATNIVSKGTGIELKYKGALYTFFLPFSDEASVHNALTCIAVLFHLGYSALGINERLKELDAIDMRLQLKHGINQCTIINDSYSADLTSFNIALHFLAQQQTAQNRTVILSDFMETGKEGSELYKIIASQLLAHGVKKVVAIGQEITAYLPPFLSPQMVVKTYKTTEKFLSTFASDFFANETILVKGARSAGFERIVHALETKIHQTEVEINLTAIAHNLNEYRKLLTSGTKVMAMVKAFSYGSGTSEIASVLQFHQVDYLGVAYPDEGIVLRKAGISLPIMVMNADETTFEALVEHNLQPVLYSFAILQQFETYLKQHALMHYPVHIEIETGMNRLGFDAEDISALKEHVSKTERLRIESLFSHLAASEEQANDSFTRKQFELFNTSANELEKVLPQRPIRHIANSAAVIRHPFLQMDMVRIGIGLYGVEIETQDLNLQPVAILRTTVAQVKRVKKGETVSYNRKGTLTKDGVIATVRIGYADGYSRRLGHGRGKMWIRERLVPVIGTVCMDMTMLDVSNVPGVMEGDEVIVFGKEPSLQQVAQWADTIPYEIMTSISQRVKRVYYQE